MNVGKGEQTASADHAHDGPSGRPGHALAVVGDFLSAFNRDVTERMQRPEVRRRTALARGLRTSQLRLLSLTPAEGMRVTDLAERVGMTKQALGEFANALEDAGLLESIRDPADRRVRILRPTSRGRRAVEQSESVIAEVEAAWRDRLGAARWQTLLDLLREAPPPAFTALSRVEKER